MTMCCMFAVCGNVLYVHYVAMCCMCTVCGNVLYVRCMWKRLMFLCCKSHLHLKLFVLTCDSYSNLKKVKVYLSTPSRHIGGPEV
jgi:hypothetical protein